MNHPLVSAAYNQYEQIESGEKKEAALLFPFEIDGSLTSSYSGESGWAINGQVSLSYVFFDLDKFSGREKFSFMKKSADAYYQWVSEEVLYDALQSILKLQESYETFFLKQNELEAIRGDTEALEKRYDLEAISRTELEYSRSQLAFAEAALVESETGKDIALLVIKDIYGDFFSQDDDQFCSVIFPEISINESFTREILLQRRGDLLQSFFLVQAADSSLKGSRRSYVPDFSLQTVVYNLGGDDTSFRLSLSTAIPLSSIAYHSADVTRFTLEKEQALYNHQRLVDQSLRMLEEKQILLRGLADKTEIYQRAVEHSRKALDGIQREFLVGSRSAYDLLNGRNNYYQAIEKLVKAEAQYRHALLDYIFLSGGLDLNAIQFSF